MSDNNINPDPKDPHREDSPENKPIDNGNPEEISGERNSLSSENPPQDDDLKNPIIEKPVNEETSDEEEFLSGENFSVKENDATGEITPSEDDKILAKTDEESEEENLSKEDKHIDSPDETDTGKEKQIDEEKSPAVFKPLSDSRPKENNYQISLLNENLLKVLVTAKKGVRINSTVKEKKSSLETQNNEIYLNPRFDFSSQEIEVLIAIEDDLSGTEKKVSELSDSEEPSALVSAEIESDVKSNYQINLINENLLKIKITTVNAVRIDSVARDKKNSAQIQSNKIYLKQMPGYELQNIEITIEIDKETVQQTAGIEDGKVRLIPNPEVVDLIQPPDYSPFFQGEQNFINEDASYKNPFDALRKLIRKNVAIGLAAAVILHLAVAGVVFFNFSKKAKDAANEEPSRLIVLRDLPDPKIKLEDVEDPNKPKVEEPVIKEPENKEPNREIPPRKIVKPPIVTRPKKDLEETKLDSTIDAELTRGLDSLRRLREELQFLDSNMALNDSAKSDSTKSDSLKAAYEIPDSLRNNFAENDIGLAMYYPLNWKLTDQREINKNEKEFKGVVLTDTTADQPGTMTMFIFLDNENKDYNAEDFKTEFKMNDSNLTAFSKEPKTLAGFTEYRFYIFNKLGTEKLSLRASVRKQFFDQYKNEIEAVVRSIRIRKKEDL